MRGRVFLVFTSFARAGTERGSFVCECNMRNMFEEFTMHVCVCVCGKVLLCIWFKLVGELRFWHWKLAT